MKRVSGILKVLLIFPLLLMLSSNVLANSNSLEKINIIEDAYQYFTDEEIEFIKEEIEKLPENYKFIILSSITGDIKEISKALFNNRNFSQDTILILILKDDRKIYITTGDVLEKKGLDQEFFNREIESYFLPKVDEGNVAYALVNLARGISNDIPKQLVKEKNSPKIPTPPKNTESSNSKNTFFGYSNQFLWTSGIIILVLILWFFSVKGFKIKK
ncbi:hypothetical protein BHF71_10500 [Vulcanibacillus modesticaldus]|uniref:TPM domain-containing protein n=1 Tax=Vulcanibacillus modesticaldus TaxID=337097 RepID=A0A1D2YTE5_9BACI|nr:TPM domain-containing protein [Vulcanibacillus modesticaldus]OEF98967.1 hypothetical protein BHF71_10500 [Vulcanibacillus modesticaldus]